MIDSYFIQNTWSSQNLGSLTRFCFLISNHTLLFSLQHVRELTHTYILHVMLYYTQIYICLERRSNSCKYVWKTTRKISSLIGYMFFSFKLNTHTQMQLFLNLTQKLIKQSVGTKNQSQLLNLRFGQLRLYMQNLEQILFQTKKSFGLNYKSWFDWKKISLFQCFFTSSEINDFFSLIKIFFNYINIHKHGVSNSWRQGWWGWETKCKLFRQR